MKKGHRRTNSQTIGLCHSFQPKIQKVFENQLLLFEPKMSPEFIHPPNKKYDSIQSLLQKSQNHITQRVLYIENLQQPNIIENTSNEFAFGKGVNYKLNNFKLNMGQIPQVPKSNQSTSLQGENKIQILEKQLFFTHEPIENSTPLNTKLQKQSQKTTKFIPKHLKTSSAVGMKKIGKQQKNQKTQLKTQIKSFRQIMLKQNPLRRPKLQYQIPKKISVSIKEHQETPHLTFKNIKQTIPDRFHIGDHKKKKMNLVK